MTGSSWRYVSAARRRLLTRDRVLIFEAPGEALRIDRRALLVVRATAENLRDLAWFQNAEYLQTFSEFLREGHSGYLAYVDGRCVHRSWLIKGSSTAWEHWSRAKELGPSEGFLHYCETASEARGLGVFPVVLSRVVRDNPALHIRMSIDERNYSSRKAATKAGWVLAEDVTFTVLVGVRWQRRRPLVPESSGPGLSQ